MYWAIQNKLNIIYHIVHIRAIATGLSLSLVLGMSSTRERDSPVTTCISRPAARLMYFLSVGGSVIQEYNRYLGRVLGVAPPNPLFRQLRPSDDCQQILYLAIVRQTYYYHVNF